MAKRTRTRPTKNTTTAPAKKTTPRPAADHTTPRPDLTPVPPTGVDFRKPLTRRRLFVGPHGAHEQAAIRAALASAAARLPIPVLAWHGPVAHLTDGTVLTHTPPHTTTDQPPTFTATIPCRYGATHHHTIRTADDLHQARYEARICQAVHTTEDQHYALHAGIQPVTPPKTPAVLALRDGITRARAATTDTQPLPLHEITNGLTARADQEKPREHTEHADG